MRFLLHLSVCPCLYTCCITLPSDPSVQFVPNWHVLRNCSGREIGLFEKQSSFFFQAQDLPLGNLYNMEAENQLFLDDLLLGGKFTLLYRLPEGNCNRLWDHIGSVFPVLFVKHFNQNKGLFGSSSG